MQRLMVAAGVVMLLLAALVLYAGLPGGVSLPGARCGVEKFFNYQLGFIEERNCVEWDAAREGVVLLMSFAMLYYAYSFAREGLE